MKKFGRYFMMMAIMMIVGCDREDSPGDSRSTSSLTDEESRGLEILTEYATHLVGIKGFPALEPFSETDPNDSFRTRLKSECPNALDASVRVGRYGYIIGPRPQEVIAGDKTNRVNTRLVRQMNTPGVISHSEVVYDYATSDGKTGSIPATVVEVERKIEGQVVKLVFSTERSQQGQIQEENGRAN